MISSDSALTFKQQHHKFRRVAQCWFSAVRGLTVEGRAVIRCRWYDRTTRGQVIEAAIDDCSAGADWQPGSCPFCPVPFHRLVGVAARGEAGQVQTGALGAGDDGVHRNRCKHDRLAWLHWKNVNVVFKQHRCMNDYWVKTQITRF